MISTTYCYNLGANAMTTWRNIAFSRIWRMGGKYYGIRESGVYELSGDTDNGTPIEAYAMLAPSDFGSDRLKRLSYLTIDSNAQGSVKVTGDETSSNATQFVTAKRVKLGKGLKSRYLVVEIDSDQPGFEVSKVTLYPEVLKRGVK